MPVERYKVGRRYTEREHTAADFADPEAVREVMESLAAREYTIEGRLADAERRARAYLHRANMPIDRSAPPYGDPAWLRANERKSLDWYAINILNTITILRKQIERGDVELAVDLALDLGVLAAEARMIGYVAENTTRGGQGVRESDRCLDAAAQREEWRARAKELWASPPWRTQTAVAKRIHPDPKKRRSITRAIRDLDPRMRK